MQFFMLEWLFYYIFQNFSLYTRTAGREVQQHYVPVVLLDVGICCCHSSLYLQVSLMAHTMLYNFSVCMYCWELSFVILSNLNSNSRLGKTIPASFLMVIVLICRRGEILATSGHELKSYWQMMIPFSYAVVSGAVGSCSVLFAKSLYDILLQFWSLLSWWWLTSL